MATPLQINRTQVYFLSRPSVPRRARMPPNLGTFSHIFFYNYTIYTATKSVPLGRHHHTPAQRRRLLSLQSQSNQ